MRSKQEMVAMAAAMRKHAKSLPEVDVHGHSNKDDIYLLRCWARALDAVIRGKEFSDPSGEVEAWLDGDETCDIALAFGDVL